MARSVPSVPTEQTGNVLSAQLWNSGVKTVNDFLKNKPAFRSTFSNTPPPIPNNTWVALPFDSVLLDTDAGHSSAVNNSRYTCQVAGVYWVKGSCFLNQTAGATTRTDTTIAKNGSTLAGSATFQNRLPSEPTWYVASSLIRLNVGDYVEIWVRQFTGGTISPANADINVIWISS